MLSQLFFPEGHGRRCEGMEGLRGFSVWLVFCTHLCITFGGMFCLADVAATPLRAQPGWRLKLIAWGACSNYGVDLFFLLSGFLLFRMMIARQGRFHYGRYLWQRITRVYPALLLSLTFVAWVCMRLDNRPVELGQFVQNALLLNGIFELNVRAYNPVTWSLMYEFVFYLLCPAALLLARWGVLRSAGRFLLLAYPLALTLLCLPNAYARALMFLAGGLLAVQSDARLTVWARRLPEPVVIGFYLTATTIFALRPDFCWDRSTLIFAPAGMALMVKACYGAGLLNRVCRWTWLRAFGNISYSFYLLHLLCLTLVGRAMMRWSGLPSSLAVRFLILAAAGMALSLLLSALLYVVAERGYFVRSSNREAFWTRLQSAVVLPASCAVALAFCGPQIVDEFRARIGRPRLAFDSQRSFRGLEIAGTAHADEHDGALQIEAYGIDPQVLLPPLPADLKQPPILCVALDAPADTYMQVFYLPNPSGGYDEANSRCAMLHRGANEVQIPLPLSAAGARVRVDPVAVPGHVAIRSIIIR